MTQNNFVGECTDVETDDPNLVGNVIQTTPAANTQVEWGSTVSIQIGKAKDRQQATVPLLGEPVAHGRQEGSPGRRSERREQHSSSDDAPSWWPPTRRPAHSSPRAPRST
ncbi:PASTA domain-containing protein [Streptomyces sp. NPDC026665]|uniref:PASTA domain-containing protein n=1 Tax=Streptomyces sp. NPDC026665 TaxID=3154798 RepID=UPI0033F52EDF